MFAAAALVRLRSAESRSRSSTWMGSAWANGSSPCTRERSMSSMTRVARRCASLVIRPAKRATASGSSAQASTDSARSERAATGVFSSWLTFATKSRRTSSTRRASVLSATRTRTCSSASGAIRAASRRFVPRRRGISTSMSRIRRSAATWCTARVSPAWVRRPSRTSPSAVAVGLDRTIRSARSRTTEADRRTARTSSASPSPGSGCCGVTSVVGAAEEEQSEARAEEQPNGCPDDQCGDRVHRCKGRSVRGLRHAASRAEGGRGIQLFTSGATPVHHVAAGSRLGRA